MDDIRLQNIERDVTEIKVTLAVNTQLLEQQGAQLAEHMRRTDANEELIKIALIPIMTMRRLGRALMWVVGLGAALAAIYEVYKG